MLDIGAETGLAAPTPPQGAYLHIPFCFHKCHYCDFYSIVDSQDRQAAFTARLIAEMQAAAGYFTQSIETIFIGGGTPTLLRVELWRALLVAIDQCLPRREDCEFTVEANPETVTPELAATLTAGGVNRISIGCQSFDPRHLKTLERWHDPQNVARSVGLLRDAGIDNINLDLIFAIPGQSLKDWLNDLDRALELEPQHISCYGLMYEPNTPLTIKMKRGQIARADEDLEAAMYEATIDRLARAGYEHYEISNWARDREESEPARLGSPALRAGRTHGSESRGTYRSHRCQHNLLYWSNANWWALGPSASGHMNGVRWKNVPRLGEYLESESLPPVMDVERLDEDGRVGEELMLGLRLIEGIPVNRVRDLLERGTRGQARRASIETHVSGGLLERAADRLRFTRAGLLLADSVLSELV